MQNLHTSSPLHFLFGRLNNKMQITFATVLVLVALSAGFSHAQDELIGLDEPYEYEGNDIDIWGEEFKIPEDQALEAKELLLSICNVYDLTVNGEAVDCSNIKLLTKNTETLQHTIRKREVDDTPLEGSGEEPPELEQNEQEPPTELPVPVQSDDGETPKIALYAENEVDENKNQSNSEVEPKEETVEEKPEKEPKPSEDSAALDSTVEPKKSVTEEEAVKEEQPKEEGVTVEPKKSVTEEEAVKEEQPKEEGVPIVEEPKIEEDDEASPIQVKSPVVLPEETNASSTGAPTSIPNDEQQSTNPPTPVPETNDQHTSEAAKAPAALPSDLAETGSTASTGKEEGSVDEKTGKPKEAEKVDDQQSANAELNFSVQKEHKHDEHAVEGSESDKTVMNMATSANAKAATNEQPSAGESSKDIQKAGKDTTVLIVLFAIVIAVGVLAFAYNYVRKQKKRRETTVAYDGHTGSTKRSTQNLSNNGKTDVEQGTELKPLMKNSDQKAAGEYSDKGNGKIEEISEK